MTRVIVYTTLTFIILCPLFSQAQNPMLAGRGHTSIPVSGRLINLPLVSGALTKIAGIQKDFKRKTNVLCEAD